LYLHIDLAKAGYNASNRVNYTRQMTVCLAHQEAVYWFGTYLQWASPATVANSGADSSLDDNKEDKEQTSSAPDLPAADNSDDEGKLDDDLSYHIAKTPAPHVSAAPIISEFHATDFLIKLDAFLESPSINPAVQPNLDVPHLQTSQSPFQKSPKCPKMPCTTRFALSEANPGK
jgi:hypothetical protein